jgi:hypothetical protein
MKTSSNLTAVAFIAAAIFLTTTGKAQTTPANAARLGIGLEAAEPTGSARIGSNFILGGTARLQYGISNTFALTFTSGAYHFFTKTIPGTDTKYDSYGVIPIKVGIKEFFVPNVYFGAETGVGIEASSDHFGPARLILSPALGYANTNWDVGFRYENFSSTGGHYGLLGLRIAYGFAL